MTPADVSYARGELGLSVAQLAAELGVDRKTVYRWEGGESPIPRMAGLALSYLLVAQQSEEARKRAEAA